MTQTKRVAWLAAIVGAALIGLLSAGLLLFGFILPLIPAVDAALAAVLIAMVGLLGLGFSIVWVVMGIRAVQGRPAELLFPKAWPALVAIWVLIVGGGFLLPEAVQSRPVFAFFHVLAMVLPALALFSWSLLAAGRASRLSVRQVVVMATAGASSTTLAFTFEVVALFISIVVVIAVALLVPGGQAEVDRLLMEFERWSQMPPGMAATEDLIAVLGSPVVIGVLALTLAVATPIIEELVKTLLVAVIGYWRRPGLLTAFLWGAACGLGFALVEGVLNGGMGLGATSEWLAAVGSRVPATAMHILTCGLTGLGWGYFWQKRRRWMLPLLYGVAIVFHGLWNLSAVGLISASSVSVDLLASEMPQFQAAMAVVGVILLAALALLALTGVIVVPLTLRKRAEKASALPVSTPPSEAPAA
ncbi:MAG: PrsW family intramembrane metalloprotease [Anaerolineae bacterium]|nr:PrsW family intramembrane metalloprotease [Anaerolineae bacterium]